VACVVVGVASAQSLDDWKQAQRAAESDQGADSIPYSSLRSEAKSRQDKVNDLCKEDEFKTDHLGTRALREQIAGLKKKQEQDAAALRQLKEQMDALAAEIDKNSKVLEEKEKALRTDLSDLDIRIARATKCLEARTSVQQTFREAIDKAKGESDSEIKAIASKLIEYWEKKRATHEDAIKNVKTSIENAEKRKKGDM
jgi:hypothetical protein